MWKTFCWFILRILWYEIKFLVNLSITQICYLEGNGALYQPQKSWNEGPDNDDDEGDDDDDDDDDGGYFNFQMN